MYDKYSGEMVFILKATKRFLKGNRQHYNRKHIDPLVIPENVYVFNFGKEKMDNRILVKYSRTWTGRIKINEIDLRLHKQQNPRQFKRESDLINYLKKHLTTEDGVVRIKRRHKSKKHHKVK